MTEKGAGRVLEELAAVIDARSGGDPGESYVARLLQGDRDQLLKKLVEEAGELALAAKGGDRDRVTKEAADLLFHLLVTLSSQGLGVGDVLEELGRRQGVSGLDEKAGRRG